ncbi:hypothetical protein CWS02_10225 [Enterobacter sp. EA-1]|nr:hypothetical protein CWS02_10225 [Enterobacter sp. EA-1]
MLFILMLRRRCARIAVLHMLCLIGLGLSGIYYDDDTGIGQEAALCHAVATGFLAQEKAGWGTTEEQERT